MVAKTWNKGLDHNVERMLSYASCMEIAQTRAAPIDGEFFIEARSPEGWCDRMELLDIDTSIRVMDAMGFDANAHMGVLANAWGDALKGIR